MKLSQLTYIIIDTCNSLFLSSSLYDWYDIADKRSRF